MCYKYNFVDEKSINYFNNNNFIIIIDFYLLRCPVIKQDRISHKGNTFKELGWEKGSLTSLYNEMIKLLSDYKTCIMIDNGINVDMSLKKIEETTSNKDSNFEYIIIKQTDLSKTASIFYAIRNALAHGTFLIVDQRNRVYYFENKKNNEMRAMIRLKEATLLKWIDFIYNYEVPKRRKKK